MPSGRGHPFTALRRAPPSLSTTWAPARAPEYLPDSAACTGTNSTVKSSRVRRTRPASGHGIVEKGRHGYNGDLPCVSKAVGRARLLLELRRADRRGASTAATVAACPRARQRPGYRRCLDRSDDGAAWTGSHPGVAQRPQRARHDRGAQREDAGPGFHAEYALVAKQSPAWRGWHRATAAAGADGPRRQADDGLGSP